MREEYPQNKWAKDNEMIKRIENYKKAKNNPLKRIGKNRKPSGATLPKSPGMAEKRFEQLNHEGRGTRVTYQEGDAHVAATAHVVVMDPRDLIDVVLPSISVEEENS